VSAAGAPAQQKIVTRTAEDNSDFEICVELQQAIWRYSAIDTVPEQMFVVASKTGGQVLLALRAGSAVGFALTFAGWREGRIYLHSHMVGVLPEYQNQGVGRLLKAAQREDALSRGLDLIEWTFDPLQLKNARFNIARLGAIVRHYEPNLYGRTSSPLHAGLPTDRLVAEWWVRSSRVEDAISESARLGAGKAVQHIAIPSNIRELCQTQPEMAAKIQSRVRARFEELIAGGYAATGFEVSKEQGVYLMEPYED
jgi:predicted GNAT superfamily acetyltransferase